MTSIGWRESSASSTSIARVSPACAPTRPDSISSSRRPEPSSTTRSRWTLPPGSTTSITSVSPGCAGRPSTGTSSATEERSASISASIASSGTSASITGTSSDFQSGAGGVGWTATVAVKLQPSLSEDGSW